jgi:hypothetical protein
MVVIWFARVSSVRTYDYLATARSNSSQTEEKKKYSDVILSVKKVLSTRTVNCAQEKTKNSEATFFNKKVNSGSSQNESSFTNLLSI